MARVGEALCETPNEDCGMGLLVECPVDYESTASHLLDSEFVAPELLAEHLHKLIHDQYLVHT
jgi:hypothetical protein